MIKRLSKYKRFMEELNSYNTDGSEQPYNNKENLEKAIIQLSRSSKKNADKELEDILNSEEFKRYNIDLNKLNYPYTPLIWACREEENANKNTIKVLLEHGADPYNFDTFEFIENDSPLVYTFKRKNYDLVNFILENADSKYDKDKGLLLCWACYKENTKLVRLLLEHGADTDSNYAGYTPIFWAIRNGNIVIFKLLLNSGVDINNDNGLGQSPLSYICHIKPSMHYKRFVELSLEHGADVNYRDKSGITPLLWACQYDISVEDIEVVKLLLEHGADPDIYGNTPKSLPLYNACWYENKELVKLLLEHGADPNITARKFGDETPLFVASFEKFNEDIVKLLLEYGAWRPFVGKENDLPYEFNWNKGFVKNLIMHYLNKNKDKNESTRIRKFYRNR